MVSDTVVVVVDDYRRWPTDFPRNRRFICFEAFLRSLKEVGAGRRVLLVCHGNNSDARNAPPPDLGDPERETNVGCAARLVLGQGGRVLVFSGGHPNCVQDLRKELADNPAFVEGHHFGFFAFTEPCALLDAMAEKRLTELQCDVRIDALVNSTPDLGGIAALDILLQGYLAIRAPCVLLGRDAGHFKAENGVLQQDTSDALARTACGVGQRLLGERAAGERLKEPEDPRDPKVDEEGFYWFDECMCDVGQNAWDDLCRKNDRLRSKAALKMVWLLLRSRLRGIQDDRGALDVEAHIRDKYGKDGLVCQGDVHGLEEEAEDPMQRYWSCLFRDAHREYMSLFFTELEKIRKYLSHNRFKQLFVNKLMNHGRLLSVEERFRRTETAWKHLRSPGHAEDDERDLYESAMEAVDAWPSIRKGIESFFDREPEGFGLCLTEAGRRKRNLILSGPNCLASQIESFINAFGANAQNAPDVRKKALADFSDACDRLQDELSGARYSELDAKLFGGTFTFINLES